MIKGAVMNLIRVSCVALLLAVPTVAFAQVPVAVPNAPSWVAPGTGTPLRYISVGSTEDEHAVCTAACRLWSVLATNTAATVAYLKCENDTAANTAPGTDIPEFSIAIPGATTGGGFSFPLAVGASFSVALTCWVVTGAADSDVAEVGANAVHLNYVYTLN